jgi:general secretion pathway protein L
MAQTIIGLDIGSYSVKLSALTTSFRSVAWTGFREVVVPKAARENPESAAADVLAELAKDPKYGGAFVVTALPGDRAMTRFVTFPFSDPKRIDAVLGFELQNRLPLTVADMIYTFQVTGPTPDGKTEVFAAACKRSTLSTYLGAVSGSGLDPRIVTLDTASYLNLYDQLQSAVTAQLPTNVSGEKDAGEKNEGGLGTVAFIDIGHKTTKVCIVENGRLCTARSIGRGGLAVTKAIQLALGVDFETAEKSKHENGQLPLNNQGFAGQGGPPPTPLSRAIADAMQPLVVSLRQTIQAFVSERKRDLDRIYVTGGGARLDGLYPWLEAELGRPVERLPIERLEISRGSNAPQGADVAAKGIGLALVQAAASRHRTTLDFRRAEFAYAGDFEFVKDRLRSLVAMAAILVIVGSAWAVVKNRSLEKQLADQKAQLESFSARTLGQKMNSFSKALKVLQSPPDDGAEQDLFPPMTATVILERITAFQSELNREAVAPVDGASPRPAQPGGPADDPPPRLRNRVGGGIQPPSRPELARPAGVPTAPPFDPTARPSAIRTPRTLPQPPGGGAPFIPPGATSPLPGAVPPIGMPSPDGASAAPPVPGDPSTAPAAATGSAPAGDSVSSASKIELSNVEVDVFGDVTITAETHESNVNGKEIFRQRIESDPCFREVKRRDIGEVVSTGRHSDWVRFEVTFKVRCPKAGETEGTDADKRTSEKADKPTAEEEEP